MIHSSKKYTDIFGTEFYCVVFTNPNIDINRVYVGHCLNLIDINFNNCYASYPLNRINSINIDYINEPFLYDGKIIEFINILDSFYI